MRRLGQWVAVSAAFSATLQPAAAFCPHPVSFDTRPSHVYTPGACDAGPPCSSDLGTSVTSSLSATYWRAGYGYPSVGGGADNGSLSPFADPNGWVRFESGSPAYIAGDWNEDFRIDGCIDSPPTLPRCMAVAMAEQRNGIGYFALMSAENDESETYYDLSQPDGSPIVLAPIPQPRITDTRRGPPGYELVTVKNNAVTAGLYLDGPSCDVGLIVGYRIYQEVQIGLGAPPIDRHRSHWQLAPGGAGPEGQPIPIDTTTEIPVRYCGRTYFVLTLVFDSGFETEYVSRNFLGTPIALCPDLDCDGYPGFCHAPEVPLDCDETNPAIHPFATEVCNGSDENCNGVIDEDSDGVDSDADGIRNACDNCRFAHNPFQNDADADSVGNVCDNCPTDFNTSQGDLDVDSAGDACDNCGLDFNPAQTDFDDDAEGDACDLDDGLIYVFGASEKDRIEWQPEQGASHFNVYAGDSSVLRDTGVYSQAPGSNPLAARHCGVTENSVEEPGAPPSGAVQFSLVAGVAGGAEGSLGTNGAGVTRPNANPCP